MCNFIVESKMVIESNAETLTYDLHDDILLEFLSWLDDGSCIAKCKVICKRWKNLLSSDYFINKWNNHQEKSKSQPLLLMGSMSKNLIYSFTTKKWKKTWSSTLKQLPKEIHGIANLKASYEGVLLLEISFGGPFLGILDPTVGSWSPLPPPCVVTMVMATTISKGDENGKNGDGFVVFVGGKSGIMNDGFLLEMYDSKTKQWQVMGSLNYPITLRNDEIIVDENYLIFNILRPNVGVLVHDMVSKSWNNIGLPSLLESGMSILNCRVVCLLDKVLLVVSLYNGESVCEIILWKFERNCEGWQWKEVEKMPSDVLERFVRSSSSCSKWFECVGVGDFICFRAHASIDVVSYDVKSCEWNWLPSCNVDSPDHKFLLLKMMTYNPCSMLKVSEHTRAKE